MSGSTMIKAGLEDFRHILDLRENRFSELGFSINPIVISSDISVEDRGTAIPEEDVDDSAAKLEERDQELVKQLHQAMEQIIQLFLALPDNMPEEHVVEIMKEWESLRINGFEAFIDRQENLNTEQKQQLKDGYTLDVIEKGKLEDKVVDLTEFPDIKPELLLKEMKYHSVSWIGCLQHVPSAVNRSTVDSIQNSIDAMREAYREFRERAEEESNE